jgi:hypothetical protein
LQQTKDSKAARPILQGQNPPRLVIGDSLLVIGDCLDIYHLPVTIYHLPITIYQKKEFVIIIISMLDARFSILDEYPASSIEVRE